MLTTLSTVTVLGLTIMIQLVHHDTDFQFVQALNKKLPPHLFLRYAILMYSGVKVKESLMP